MSRDLHACTSTIPFNPSGRSNTQFSNAKLASVISRDLQRGGVSRVEASGELYLMKKTPSFSVGQLKVVFLCALGTTPSSESVLVFALSVSLHGIVTLLSRRMVSETSKRTTSPSSVQLMMDCKSCPISANAESSMRHVRVPLSKYRSTSLFRREHSNPKFT